MIIMNFAGKPLLNPQIGMLEKSEEPATAGVSEILFSLDGATEVS